MGIKKILTFSAAGMMILSSSLASAGSPDLYTPGCPACVSTFVPYLYLGVSGGWAYSNWQDFVASDLPFDADTDGFAYGGKIGYQFAQHFGIEGGAYALPDSDQSVTFPTLVSSQPLVLVNTQVKGEVQSWVAYGAATVRAAFPGDPYLQIMGKLGGAYRALHHTGDLYSGVGDGSYGTIVLGANVEYDLAQFHYPVTLGVDYLYVPGSNDAFFQSNPPFVNSDAAPAAQIVVGTISLHLVI